MIRSHPLRLPRPLRPARFSIVLLALLAACTSTQPAPPPQEPAHFEVCDGLPGGGSELPDVVLPCFTDGEQVNLTRLGGPLVINVWASSCPPCLEELPAFQRLADSGMVPVLGVDAGDSRDAALGFAKQAGVRFPMLFDRPDEFRKAMGEVVLPLTYFVSVEGKVTSYRGEALDDEALAALVRDRLGVR